METYCLDAVLIYYIGVKEWYSLDSQWCSSLVEEDTVQQWTCHIIFSNFLDWLHLLIYLFLKTLGIIHRIHCMKHFSLFHLLFRPFQWSHLRSYLGPQWHTSVSSLSVVIYYSYHGTFTDCHTPWYRSTQIQTFPLCRWPIDIKYQSHCFYCISYSDICRIWAVSNFKVNYGKIEALNISLSLSSVAHLQSKFAFKWQHKAIKYLGIKILGGPQLYIASPTGAYLS